MLRAAPSHKGEFGSNVALSVARTNYQVKIISQGDRSLQLGYEVFFHIYCNFSCKIQYFLTLDENRQIIDLKGKG